VVEKASLSYHEGKGTKKRNLLFLGPHVGDAPGGRRLLGPRRLDELQSPPQGKKKTSRENKEREE